MAKHHLELYWQENERLRADTVREMQERLKKKFINHSWGGLYVPDYLIEQVVKEMLEGTKW